MSVILAQGKMQKLPILGSRVMFKNGHKFGSTYVVCKSSVMEGSFENHCPPNLFLSLVSRYKLGSSDIIKFEEMTNNIEKNFIRLDGTLKEHMLLSLLQNLIIITIDKGYILLGRENCSNCIISKVTLTTAKNCKHVEIKSNKYIDFPYWSFGMHPSNRKTMLFGYLEIQPVYGFYLIRDRLYQMVCIIITDDCNKTDIEVSQLQNSYVLIEKYNVITEIFNDNETPNIEYIVAKADDIYVIHSTTQNNNIFGVKSEETEYANVISFVILKKSTVSLLYLIFTKLHFNFM